MRTTPSTHRKLGLRNLCAGALLLGVSFVAGAADDTALFSTQFPPNVMLMVDNSGSMMELMTPPAFDGSLTPTCSVVPSPTGTGNINDQDGKPVRYNCGAGANCRFEFYAADVSDEVLTTGGSGYITRRFCGETRRLYFDGAMTALGNRTRLLKNHVDWYFSIDTDNDSLTYGPLNQTADEIVAEVDAANNGTHYIDGTTFPLYQRARMTAAKEIARDVIYQTNSDCPPYLGDCGVYQDNVRFGLSTFRTTSNGGYVSVPIDTYSNNRVALNSGITALDPGSFTPLGETLFQLYTYFMSRSATATNRPLGVNGTTRFPAYGYTTAADGPAGAAPADPVTQSCQKNFIILITDGGPTSDNFATSGTVTVGFSSYSGLVGDYAPDAVGDPDIGTDSTPEVGDPPWDTTDGAGWLDDIAYFMQSTDMRPDLSGIQKVDVYTIGFATTGVANVLLEKTATRGNGLYASSSQADVLTVALVDAISDIIVKAQSFTAATVPASRATDGNNFFASFFRPDNLKPFWEGHLKNFEYNAAGEVLDKPVPPATVGDCALEDPLAPAQCKVGRLKVELPGYWDAANEIPGAAETGSGIRKLLVSAYTTAPPSSTPATPATFNTTTMTAALLNITSTTEIAGYSVAGSTTGITTTENLADAIARYIRGCTFSSSTTCTDRGDGKKLWDIFHSNPVVVGPPNAGQRDVAYKEFVNRYAHRKRVIYAGSNGGFVHGFNTGEWDTSLNPDNYNRGTGAEEFGFMAYPARQKIKVLPKQVSPKLITMDGSPQSADVWLYPSATSVAGDATTWNTWRTVLIGGMRQGGRALFALDVTNPPDTANPSGVSGGPSYPGYLWEFPCESTNALCTGTGLPGSRTYAAYMGETWSEPVITKVKVRIDCTDTTTTTCPRYDRWVAIFGAGYDENGDPNKAHSATPSATQYDSSNTTATIREGRALFMVDIKSGKVLGMRRYDNSASLGTPEMRYAFVATPSVFDLDFDGYADAVFAADLGGNVWKWLIHDAVLDPINGTGDVQHNSTDDLWPFFKIFTAASCGTSEGCSVPHYRSFFFPPTGALVEGTLWLALGSGERNNLPYIGTQAAEKNRYYVFQDRDPFERETTALTCGSRYTDGLRCTDSLQSTDFIDAASLSGTCNPPPAPAVGFYLEAVQGEKFVTDSTIFFGVVLTSSYLPTTSSDPCDVGGESYLYGFKLKCGEGIFPEDPSNPGTPQRVISIGGGLANRPRVSVGPVSDGGGGGPCADMVVVITSEGGAYTDCPGGRPDSGIHTKSWRDD